jgi:hypothetical protein
MARHNSLQLQAHDPDSPSPILESHRPTTANQFLQSLFTQERYRSIAESQLSKRLDQCYINFSHFTEDLCDSHAHDSLSLEGLFGAFLRGRAIQCMQGQTGIDLVIPMADLGGKSLFSEVSQADISAIIIQVKNKALDSWHFTPFNIHEAKFDLRHFNGMGSRFFIGIWMSFRCDNNDFDVIDLATCTLPPGSST